MSAEVLRRAAALMRERAEAAAVSAPSPWFVSEADIVTDDEEPIETLSVVTRVTHWRDAAAQRNHVASWHPAVARAVADVLDEEAQLLEGWAMYSYHPDARPADHKLVAVARAYLGGADR